MQKELIVAPCSKSACRFACENFHYARVLPGGKLVKYGVWEDGYFIGAIVYGDSATINMHTPYDLDYTQVCELRRVALTTHEHPVTEIVSKSLKLLHRDNPNLELVISYADKNQNHLGVIYQAGNWIYEGETRDRLTKFKINGDVIHCHSVYDRYGTSSFKWIKENVDKDAIGIKERGKFKYIFPLTKRARKRFCGLHKPYPKVC